MQANSKWWCRLLGGAEEHAKSLSHAEGAGVTEKKLTSLAWENPQTQGAKYPNLCRFDLDEGLPCPLSRGE